MTRRKNTKRIDPRYFLKETIIREEEEDEEYEAFSDICADVDDYFFSTGQAPWFCGQQGYEEGLEKGPIVEDRDDPVANLRDEEEELNARLAALRGGPAPKSPREDPLANLRAFAAGEEREPRGAPGYDWGPDREDLEGLYADEIEARDARRLQRLNNPPLDLDPEERYRWLKSQELDNETIISARPRRGLKWHEEYPERISAEAQPGIRVPNLDPPDFSPEEPDHAETVAATPWGGFESKEARDQAAWDQYLLNAPEDTRYEPGDPMPAVLPWDEPEERALAREPAPEAPPPSHKWGSTPAKETLTRSNLRQMVMEEISAMSEASRGDSASRRQQQRLSQRSRKLNPGGKSADVVSDLEKSKRQSALKKLAKSGNPHAKKAAQRTLAKQGLKTAAKTGLKRAGAVLGGAALGVPATLAATGAAAYDVAADVGAATGALPTKSSGEGYGVADLGLALGKKPEMTGGKQTGPGSKQSGTKKKQIRPGEEGFVPGEITYRKESLTRSNLRQMVMEELEVVLTDDEAVEMFGSTAMNEENPPGAPQGSHWSKRLPKAGGTLGRAGKSAEDLKKLAAQDDEISALRDDFRGAVDRQWRAGKLPSTIKVNPETGREAHVSPGWADKGKRRNWPEKVKEAAQLELPGLETPEALTQAQAVVDADNAKKSRVNETLTRWQKIIK